MPIVEAGRSPFLFWDGRKDSLWSQALGPLEDPAEHGGNRLAYVHLLQTHYRADYEAVFGTMPDLSHLTKNAGPYGTQAEKSAWQSLPAATREQISRAFANMGKALAAYERTFRYGESRVDRYIHGVIHQDGLARTVLSEQEKNGLRIFIGKGNCVTCHNGPLLTDQHFHNTGVASGRPAMPDLGRIAAIEKLRNDEFNCLSRYSDAKPEMCEELNFLAAPTGQMQAAFKTPGLRNVSLRPPYMHAGQIPDLVEAVRHYVRAPKSSAGDTELQPVNLAENEIQDVVALLKALSAPIVRQPSQTIPE
jgi:cytochrome c peroxidase